MLHNVFYFRSINCIGGIEQFFYYLAKKYQDLDITVVYKDADPQQLARLKRFVRTIKFEGQHLTCEKLFVCFNHEILDYVNAKETILLLHGDYDTMVQQEYLDKDCYIFKQEFDKYFGVSKTVCDSWKKITGKECELAYNPYVQEPTKKIYRLVYCGRLTPEKGGDLVELLLKRLEERGIKYMLYVYSNQAPWKNKNVVNLGTDIEACQYLTPENYDYVIIPSKTEGYCYTLIQALANGLPAIATPCPVFKELGVNELNSITIDFNGENIDTVIDQMQKKKFKFSYLPNNDTWEQLLVPAQSTYDRTVIKVEVLDRYFDLDLHKMLYAGDIVEMFKDRADYVISKGFARQIKEK